MKSPPFREILADASLAPSVHNVQPVRWQIDGDSLILLRHIPTRLPCADPKNHDILISAGAALEGASLAASRFGFKTQFRPGSGLSGDAVHEPIGRLHFKTGGQIDPLVEQVSQRCSWRGPFARTSEVDRQAILKLTNEGCFVVPSGGGLDEIAALSDKANLRFMSDNNFRLELLSWMRLSRRDPRWSLDGLNAEAMQMSRLTALGAAVLLGRLFSMFDRLGMAGALTAESGRYSKAAGIVILHRPSEENLVDQGRHFYRQWLEIERAGFVAQVNAALADDDQTRSQLHAMAGLPTGRRILTTFVIGRLPDGAKRQARARLPLDELLVGPTAGKSS